MIKYWLRSGLNAKTLARALVGKENGANRNWKFSREPEQHLNYIS